MALFPWRCKRCMSVVHTNSHASQSSRLNKCMNAVACFVGAGFNLK